MSSNSAEYQRDWYHQNKHRLRDKRRQRNIRDYLRRRAFVNDEKLRRGHCLDCNLPADLTNLPVFEFDHREPERKLFSIANCNGRSFAMLEYEMAKCDMVCANCHRLRTIDQAPWAPEQETTQDEQQTLFDTEANQ